MPFIKTEEPFEKRASFFACLAGLRAALAARRQHRRNESLSIIGADSRNAATQPIKRAR
jgi:hypothetical protein